MATAVDGDTIDLTNLTCSTIALNTGELVLVAADVSVQGPGRDALMIDGGGLNRVLYAYYGPLRIEDLTIANGVSGSYGGCLHAHGLVLTRSTVSGCRTTGSEAYGGGISVDGGGLELHDSIVSGNTALADGGAAVGGGVAVLGGDVHIDQGSMVSGNAASDSASRNPLGGGSAFGGGIYARDDIDVTASTVSENTVTSAGNRAYGGGIFGDGTTTVVSSTLAGNRARVEGAGRSYGGAIQGGQYGYGGGSVFLVGSTLSGNQALGIDDGSFTVQGGAVSAFGDIDIRTSTLTGNVAAVPDTSVGTVVRGGALATYGYDARDFRLVNSTVSGNSVRGGDAQYGLGVGGGIFVQGANIGIESSTVSFNEASHRGGGIDADVNPYLVRSVTSSIVAGNLAPESADISASFAYGDPLIVTGSHNIIIDANAEVALPSDTLTADPLLQPLADNGGPTPTHALDACSPAIDAGSNPAGEEFDQRGDPYVRVAGAAADIGAFEWQAPSDRIFADGFESEADCGT